MKANKTPSIGNKENANQEPISGAAMKEMRKFSFGFALLNFFTYFVLFAFLVMLGLQLGRINFTQGLIAVLGVLIFAYFAIPKFAKKTMESIEFLKKANSEKRNHGKKMSFT